MKNSTKTIEKQIQRLRSQVHDNFREALALKLQEKYDEEFVFVENSQSFINLIITKMKTKKTSRNFALAFSLVLVILGSGTYFYQRSPQTFLKKACAYYAERLEEGYFRQKISLVSGDDFEDYLSNFAPRDIEDREAEDLYVDLLYYGRTDYILDVVASDNLELSYWQDKPLLKLKVNQQWKYFAYQEEKLASGQSSLNPWQEIKEEDVKEHSNDFLSILQGLRNDRDLKVIINNEKEIVYQRLASQIELANGEKVWENFYFNKDKKELVKKEEVTNYQGKDYVLRVELYEKTIEDDQFSFLENDDLISLVARQYYYAGGANGFQYFATLAYDKNEQKILTINDLFSNPEQALQILSTYSREHLSEVLESPSKEMIEGGTEALAENFANFSLVHTQEGNVSGLNLHFSEYQVAAGFEGAQTLFIPLSEIQELFKY